MCMACFPEMAIKAKVTGQLLISVPQKGKGLPTLSTLKGRTLALPLSLSISLSLCLLLSHTKNQSSPSAHILSRKRSSACACVCQRHEPELVCLYNNCIVGRHTLNGSGPSLWQLGGADERSAVACCRPLVEHPKRPRAHRSGGRNSQPFNSWHTLYP